MIFCWWWGGGGGGGGGEFCVKAGISCSFYLYYGGGQT